MNTYKLIKDVLEAKKFKKEEEISNQYSWWGNFLRTTTGCKNLKISAYA